MPKAPNPMMVGPHCRSLQGRVANVCSIRRSSLASCRRPLNSCRSRLLPTSTSVASVATLTAFQSQWSVRGPNLQLMQQRYHHDENESSNGSNNNSNSKHTHLPPRMTISRASRLYRTSKLTPQQLCRHSHNLALFGENSLCLNAYAKVLPLEDILEQARESEERIQNGTPKSFLDGIPVTIKANIAVGKFWEMPNSGSEILNYQSEGCDDSNKHDRNSSEVEGDTSKTQVYESDIAKRLLKDCGAVIIGITNMDEFGMGSLGINNGLHNHSLQQQQSSSMQQQNQQYSPIYNPIPWMQRLSTLMDSQVQHDLSGSSEEEDEYWLKQIQNSTPGNPHGIDDENLLADFLKEVQHWVYGNNPERQNTYYNNDEFPLISPGGSSSGAAAATAHGSSLLSIGTDTGGSIRLPSAWTSTVGFKPTYGTFSRYGVVSYASSLDTVGFITGTTECAEIAWNCLGRHKDDGEEAACADESLNEWKGQLCRDSTARVYHKRSSLVSGDSHHGLGDKSSTSSTGQSSGEYDSRPLAKIRVGIPSAFSLQELPPHIANAWSESARLLQNNGGATLVSIDESKLSSEWIKLALASYYVLACAEASSNLSRYDGVRYGINLDLDSQLSGCIDTADGSDFQPLVDMTALEQQISATRAYGLGEEVQRRVLGGTSVLSSDRFHTHYEAAAIVRAKLSSSLENAFRSSQNDEHDDGDNKVDVMLVPTALSFPCRLNPMEGDQEMDDIDPTAAFANDVMTIPISLGGFPSVSVPVDVEKWNKSSDSPTDGRIGSDLVGMQVFSSRGSEDLVLRVANALK